MPKGDIVLINFPFTNLSGTKLRPAIVLAESAEDFTVCFITTQLTRKEETDVLLAPTSSNGLKKTSLIRTGKITTIEKSLAEGLLGRLDNANLLELNRQLKILLQIEL